MTGMKLMKVVVSGQLKIPNALYLHILVHTLQERTVRHLLDHWSNNHGHWKGTGHPEK